MPGGRPPLPTEHLKLHGGLRKGRHDDRDKEFKPEGDPIQVAPLDGEALAAWEFLVRRLPIARELDSFELVAMCEWWAEYRKWKAKGDENEYRQLVGTIAAYKQFRVIAGKFGLTPQDRVGINDPSQTTEDELDALIAG